MKSIRITLFLFILNSWVFAQSPKEKGLESITPELVKGQLEFLASDWTEGRAAGTKGAYLAADYIASMFKVYGIKPFGDEIRKMPSRKEMAEGKRPEVIKTYFQNFALLEYAPGVDQRFSLITNKDNSSQSADFGYQTDFSVRTGTVALSATAPLVFVGYGFTSEDNSYDDFKKTSPEGKIAVMMDGFPGHRDTASSAYKKFAPTERYALYMLERNKISSLQKKGAVAVIRINPYADMTVSWTQNQIYPVKGTYYEADRQLSSYYDTRMVLPGDSLTDAIPEFIVSNRVIHELFSGTGIDLKTFEKETAEKIQPASRELKGKSVSFATSVNAKLVKVRNVIGMIEGEKKDEFIVVGGHYDHVGKYEGWIWNGADDNASGTVGVMSIAKAFAATGKKPEKSVIFAAWTAEEKGLWGSKYFVQQAQKNQMNLILNLNYDMIARNSEKDTAGNQAMMTYTKSVESIEKVTRKHLEEYKIGLDLEFRASQRPDGGSDHAPFAAAGVPVFYFMAAMHPDYHQPSDELNQINWEKMTSIIRLGFLNTWEFANGGL